MTHPHSPQVSSGLTVEVEELKKDIRQILVETCRGELNAATAAIVDLVRSALEARGGGDRASVAESAASVASDLTASATPCQSPANAEIEEAFDDAAKARDEAGFLGTVADCIRYLDTELRAYISAFGLLPTGTEAPSQSGRQADAAMSVHDEQVERLRGLLERAKLCLPACYVNLHAAIYAALSPKQSEGEQG